MYKTYFLFFFSLSFPTATARSSLEKEWHIFRRIVDKHIKQHTQPHGTVGSAPETADL